MDNVRGKWVAALTLLFIAFSLVVSYFGATQTGGGAGIQGFRATGVLMAGLVGTLVPILALMLSYATIAGERESGSLQLLLTMPVTRMEVVLGKLVGHAAVLCVSILGGLGTGGLVIAAFAGAAGWEGYIAFVFGTLLFAIAFLAVGLFFSTLVAKRSTALGLAVFIWLFFNVIFEIVLFGVAALAGVELNFTGGSFTFPGWWWAIDLVNPGESLNLFAARSLGYGDFAGFAFIYPEWATAALGVAVLGAWALVPTLLALFRVRKLNL